MSGVLIVTWDGGGNVPPALGLAAALIGRGHAVRVLGHPQQASTVLSSGAQFAPYRTLPEWDPTRRRSAVEFLIDYPRLFTDRRFGDEVRRAIAEHRPDVIVVDALLPSAIAASASSGIPSIALVHTVEQFVTSNFAKGPVGLMTTLKGYPLGRALRAVDALLVASPEALAQGARSANAHYVGPIFGPGEARPTEAEAGARRILVSLSTIDYTGMQDVLQRIVDAVGDLSDDVVVTTGSSIDPADVRAPSHVVVRRSMPHAQLLAGTALVIGHGGHGTTTKALTAGVPVIARPMTPLGDQPVVAQALVHAGVGVRLPSRAAVADIRRTAEVALRDRDLHARTRALGASLRAHDGASLAADAVERVAHDARGAASERARG